MVGTSNQSVPEMASDTKDDTVDGRWGFNHPSIMLLSYSKLWDDDTVIPIEQCSRPLLVDDELGDYPTQYIGDYTGLFHNPRTVNPKKKNNQFGMIEGI